jgi:translocation and assembly module TamA
MASLPKFRKADRLRSLTLSFVFVTALGSGGLAGLCSAAAAQSLAPVPAPDETALPVPIADPDELDDDGSLQPIETRDEADIAPVPRSLDDLIPPEAVANPEVWALRGTQAPIDPAAPLSEPPAEFAVTDDAMDAALAALELPEADAGTQAPVGTPRFAIENELENFALTVPERLEPDADGEAFAALEMPSLEDVEELADFAINDTVTLAFPANEEAFPADERDQIVARFRELSALNQLEDGDDTAPQIAARARADADLLDEIMRAYGYYDSEIARELSGGRRTRENANGAAANDAATRPTVRFAIYPGPHFRFGTIDLGGLATLPDTDRIPLRSAFGLQAGDQILADEIIAQRDSLRAALGDSGFPFADVGEPALLIDHARAEGDLDLPVDPNGKYTFGIVTSSDPEFLSGRHLSRIARFSQGELYRETLETDLRRAILATGLVSSVDITPREVEPPANGEPGEVALDVEIQRAPLRTLTGGIGYGTEDGFKVEAAWEHRNLFPPEGALRVRGILGTLERVASVGFKRNNFRDRDQVLFVDAFASDIFTVAVESRTIGVRGAFERLSNFIYQKEFSWQVGAEVLLTDERNRRARRIDAPPAPRRQFTIAGLFGSATIDQSDDLLDPTSGFRATLFVAPETSRSQGQQSTYLRSQLDAAAYRSVGDRAVLAGRFRAATIAGADIGNVAPSRRLYGGGGSSVRGYGFQGVGPRDEFGEATGGASLLEVSVEARINTGLLDGAIQVVPFFDIGSVSQSSVPNFGFVRYAAGLGVRYKTGFGPVRIDVGVPLNRGEFDAPVVVFVGLGQAF